MDNRLESTYERLFLYCRQREFSGNDPFDGLNSRVFRLTPLRYSRIARLAWLQLIKRSPVDVRPLLMVRPGVNPKTLALFGLAELARYRKTQNSEHLANANDLAARLMPLAIRDSRDDHVDTLAFGYNFDWQSSAFFAPVGTPAIVPSAFAARFLVELWREAGDPLWAERACAVARFVVRDLKRPVESADELCFSYTPLDEIVVYNASLLAAEVLANAGSFSGDPEFLSLAEKAARFVVRRQRADGSWYYGASVAHEWIDNFHTAYILLSLTNISSALPSLDAKLRPHIDRGAVYWMDTFFREDGAPGYYHDRTFPIDIHSAASAIVTLSGLHDRHERALPLAMSVAKWCRANMLDPAGYFYYQRRRNRTNTRPFMRWGQAWMAYALARLLEETEE